MSSNLLEFLGPEVSTPVKSKYGDDNVHKAIAGTTFLPRLQLCQASSNLCKRNKVPNGTYAVVKGKDVVVHLLGDAVDALIVSWRPRALRFEEGGKLLSFYNPATPGFKQVEIDAQVKDSGCLYGPEYLVYLPSVGEFCTFHFNNPTMRMAASGMLPNIGGLVTCKVEFIEKGKNSWHGPVILVNSTPMTPPQDREAFARDYVRHRDAFNNPKETEELEAAPEEAASQQRDR